MIKYRLVRFIADDYRCIGFLKEHGITFAPCTSINDFLLSVDIDESLAIILRLKYKGIPLIPINL